MARESEYTIAFDDFDVSLLPVAARTPGSPEFVEAVRDIVAREYQALGGWAQIVVNEGDRTLRVTWGSAANRPGPLESAVEKLRRGQYDAAIQTLEVLRFQQPDNAAVAFNLGMALSDRGRLPAAITHLRRATALAPSDAHAHVALGVALARDGQTTAAVASFREGVRLDGTNPWAHRNLGGCLLRAGKPQEAEPHLRRAVELGPTIRPPASAWGSASGRPRPARGRGRSPDRGRPPRPARADRGGGEGGTVADRPSQLPQSVTGC